MLVVARRALSAQAVWQLQGLQAELPGERPAERVVQGQLPQAPELQRALEVVPIRAEQKLAPQPAAVPRALRAALQVLPSSVVARQQRALPVLLVQKPRPVELALPQPVLLVRAGRLGASAERPQGGGGPL
jgi:hypothetical protein